MICDRFQPVTCARHYSQHSGLASSVVLSMIGVGMIAASDPRGGGGVHAIVVDDFSNNLIPK